MTRPSIANTQYAIDQHIKKLTDLQPGQTLILQYPPASLNGARAAWYRAVQLLGLKHLFRLSIDWHFGKLEIKHVGSPLFAPSIQSSVLNHSTTSLDPFNQSLSPSSHLPSSQQPPSHSQLHEGFLLNQELGDSPQRAARRAFILLTETFGLTEDQTITYLDDSNIPSDLLYQAEEEKLDATSLFFKNTEGLTAQAVPPTDEEFQAEMKRLQEEKKKPLPLSCSDQELLDIMNAPEEGENALDEPEEEA